MKTARITLKEIYERLVSLEAKNDLLISDNKRIMKKVFIYVLILVSLSVINIIVHMILLKGTR